MSLAELGMIVNSNFSKPLNEQAREMKFCGSYVIENSQSFKPQKTGWYKVIVVGAGGASDSVSEATASGGAGGVAIKTLKLNLGETYEIEVTKFRSRFNSIVAFSGGDGKAKSSGGAGGTGGTASGGDYNYTGNDGVSNAYSYSSAASVGVYIPELMKKNSYMTSSGYFIDSGYGVLGYGASGKRYKEAEMQSQPGAVIIIPLEVE